MTHLMSCGFCGNASMPMLTTSLSTMTTSVAAGATNVAKQSSSNN